MTKKICSMCLGIKDSNKKEKETCGFCDSELCYMNFLQPLDKFLENLDIEKLREKQKQQIKKIKETSFLDRNKRFHLKDFLSNIDDVIKLHEKMLKKID